MQPAPTAPKFSGFFGAQDETRIYYEVEGSGPPLIFCYGLLCKRDHWRHQISYFKERFTIVTFDYRGHQLSDLPKNHHNISLPWCARDIVSLMNHLDIPEAVVLGHSLGVAVISHLGEMAPERLKGSVLVCGSVNNPFQHMFFSNKMDAVYRSFARLYE